MASKLDEALGLFPSAIKCGENWSATCQAVLDAAKAELAELRKTATPAEVLPLFYVVGTHIFQRPVRNGERVVAGFCVCHVWDGFTPAELCDIMNKGAPATEA